MNNSNAKPGPSGMEERIKQFTHRCREAGLRVTPQRIAIYTELLSTDDHPSAETLYERLRPAMTTISLDTVNRTLLKLTEIGAAFVVEGTGQARRFDAGMHDHQHFRCIKCKRIVDFHHAPFDNIQVPSAIARKFKVLRKTVYLEGICDKCR